MAERPVLIVTRGLPGSGKSTRARQWAAADELSRAVVGRDTIRAEVFASARPVFGPSESLVTTAQLALIGALLRAGVSVCADDTNLPDERIHTWRRWAAIRGVPLTVWDMRDIPVEECIRRDRERAARGGRHVGADVIRQIAAVGAATWDQSAPTK